MGRGRKSADNRGRPRERKSARWARGCVQTNGGCVLSTESQKTKLGQFTISWYFRTGAFYAPDTRENPLSPPGVYTPRVFFAKTAFGTRTFSPFPVYIGQHPDEPAETAGGSSFAPAIAARKPGRNENRQRTIQIQIYKTARLVLGEIS